MNVDEIKSKANALFKQGEYASALEAWQKAMHLLGTSKKTSLQKKTLLSNMTAAYTKLGMHEQAVTTCLQALDIVHPADNAKSQEMTLKLYVRLALAYEGLGTHGAVRKALQAIVKAIPVQPEFTRTIHYHELVGLSSRDKRQGKAIPSSIKKIFKRIYNTLYGEEGTFGLTATPNLTSNMKRPWDKNGGWCRAIQNSDEILYFSGQQQTDNAQFWDHPLMKRLRIEGPSEFASFTAEEQEVFESMTAVRCVDPSMMYFFNTNSKKWRVEKSKGTVIPEARHGHILVEMNERIYLWGGQVTRSRTGDPNMYEYNPTTKTWTIVTCRNGRSPYFGCVFNYNAVAYEKNTSIYYIGGELSGQEYIDAIHRFKVWGDGTGSWETIIPYAGSAANGVGTACAETLIMKTKKTKKKKKKKQPQHKNGGKTRYRPLPRAQAACIQHGNGNEVVLIHGGEIGAEHSTELLERFNLRTHNMEACPLLGTFPTLRSEHVMIKFYYPADSMQKEYALCCGGYVPEIGSREGGKNIEKIIEHKLQLYDETVHTSTTRTGYRNSMYRLELSTLIWTRMRDQFGSFVQAAEQFGIQRQDGSICLGGGYGPMQVPGTGCSSPESLWHTYDLTVDDCGDITPHAILHAPLLQKARKDQGNCMVSTSWAGDDQGIQFKCERANDNRVYLAKKRKHWDPPHDPLRGIQCYVHRIVPHPGGGGNQMLFDTYRGPLNDYNQIVLDVASSNMEPISLDDLISNITTSNDYYKNLRNDVKWNSLVKSFLCQGNSGGFRDYYSAWHRNAFSGMMFFVPPPAACTDQLFNFVKKFEETLNIPSEYSIFSFIEQKWKAHELEYTNAKEKRTQQLKQLKQESTGQQSGKVYVLKISIQDLGVVVHRTVTVTDTINLHQLHEQVIAPAVGWQSRYHAYAYRPDSWYHDGTSTNDWIGPYNSTANDAKVMMQFFGGGFVGNSSKVELRHVLTLTDPVLWYVYDLGDYWSHKIELIRIHTREEQQPFVILDGFGACPPEDIGGPVKYCTFINAILEQLRGTGVWPPNPDWRSPLSAQTDRAREGCMEIYRDCFINKGNVNGLRFDPIHYDIEEAQKLLNLAILKRASKTKEAEGFLMSNLKTKSKAIPLEGEDEIDNMAPSKKYLKPQKETKLRRKNRGTKSCAVCGITAGLTKCGRCKQISYCGPGCQRQDWNYHKQHDCVKR